MTHAAKLLMAAVLMCAAPTTKTKSTYEAVTQALQYQAALTLGSIAKRLLSAEAKRLLVQDVTPELIESRQTEDTEQLKLAALLGLATTINNKMENSQQVADRLNDEINEILQQERIANS